MNISQIRTACRQAFSLGHTAGAQPQRATGCNHQFLQEMANLGDLATKPLDWFEAERITNVDDVDEALRDFVDDGTADAAVILVQRVIAAYLKGA